MMKKLRKLLSLTIVASLLLTSCDNDDDGGGDGGPTGPETTLSGAITADRTLDPSAQYTIANIVSVLSGVTLTIPAGTEIVSNVGADNYLVVLQGGKIDIQGTAANPVVMRANGNAGEWGGLVVCGNAITTDGVNATAEVGQLSYGGSDSADNSGNIDYLIIRDAGAQINADAQFNGLSLYAVGSGTSIDNVAIINGTDDGIEFYGGSVSPNNIYLENNEDDAVDWTEGWNGTLTNTYVANTISNFSTVIEADGVNNNPTLVNFTAISSNGGNAIQIKNDSGATIIGLTLTGFETSLDFRDDAPISNLQIDGADADVASDAVFSSSSTNASLFAWATNTSIGVGNALPANISSDLTLEASTIYTVSGPVLVNSGATLTIPAGTEIVSNSGTANYIAVLKGGSIDIQGTANSPVSMVSNDGNPWGGLLICGNATTTEGVNAIAEVGGLVYGGTDDSDNSGTINYLILRNTGAQINADSQFNGLSLYAVGSGTSIENVAVIEGADDGIEFYGGTVNVTNFYAENLVDDSVDWTEGWNGTLTNTYVSLTAAVFSTAIEADGVNGNPTLVNFTAVSVSGGIGIQIKNNSGVTINGLTLTGFETLFDFRDNAPVSNVQADGADADEAGTYTSSTTVATDFSWATN
jgi:predicted small secreted protein